MGLLLGIGAANLDHALDERKYPLLAEQVVSVPQRVLQKDFRDLESRLDQYFAQRKMPHSVYFEYLKTGTAVKSSESEPQLAASLLKLPATMDLYRAAETGKVDLGQEVMIKDEWRDPAFGNLWKSVPGASITLGRAAELALVDSDNTAINVVKSAIPDPASNREGILHSLDIPPRVYTEGRIDAITYSGFLRCLYYSCYLSRAGSQSVLEDLAANNFPGIADGVPDDITVADKTGDFPPTFSSCGIVYVPERDYILCVMLQETAGEDYRRVFREVSGMVYQAVISAG